MHKKTKNLINQKFGKLTVIEYIGKQEKREGIFWKCFCECGNYIVVHRKELCNGDTKSCGCFKSELCSITHWEGCGEISKDFYSGIIRNAKTRNIFFDLTIQQIWDLYLKQNKKVVDNKINNGDALKIDAPNPRHLRRLQSNPAHRRPQNFDWARPSPPPNWDARW